jgi:hypothetical protein
LSLWSGVVAEHAPEASHEHEAQFKHELQAASLGSICVHAGRHAR